MVEHLKFIKNLKIDLYADTANLTEIKKLNTFGYIKGYTTNPTIIKNNNIKDYSSFAKKMIKVANNKPVSFEVISDNLFEIEKQAHKISSWGKNVYVKIPITNTKKISTKHIIKNLNKNRIKLNVTAITTFDQVKEIKPYIDKKTKIIISIFAGRISDTGRDANQIIKKSINLYKDYKNVRFIWASPRQVYNIFEAEKLGCHIITLTNDILKKISLINKNLESYSLETVKMFYEDALKSKLKELF